MIGILIAAVVIAILVKTGSIGKALGFLLKYMLLPGILAFVGAFITTPMGLTPVGGIIGFIIGLVIAIKDGSRKLK